MPDLLRKTLADQDQDWTATRSHKRTFADQAGTALLYTLERDPACAKSWQLHIVTLPARLAAITIAAMSEQDTAERLKSQLCTLFELDFVPSALRAGVARSAREALSRCSGVGIQLDDQALEYGPTVGDYRFKTVADGDALHREGVTMDLVAKLDAMANRPPTDPPHRRRSL